MQNFRALGAPPPDPQNSPPPLRISGYAPGIASENDGNIYFILELNETNLFKFRP